MLRSAKTPVKQLAITAALRERIVSSRYAPGSRLPLRCDLEREFGASRATIQQAFDALHADGFIAANGRAGTVVVDRPPHLHRVALVFPTAPPQWSRFWAALDREARALARADGCELVVFTAAEALNDDRAYRSLLADVQAQRLAGIIFASRPGWGADDPILRSGIPQIALAPSAGDAARSQVYPDLHSFIGRATTALAEAGCRRVAALLVPLFPAEDLRRALAAHGWDHGTHSIQAVPLQEPAWARNLARLLFDPGHSNPPDGLIICDDNLVEHALGGLIEAGGSRPAPGCIIAHGNFPSPAPSVLPIRRLGFDAGLLLDTCLALLQRRRDGLAIPAQTWIPARFEDESAPAIATVLS